MPSSTKHTATASRTSKIGQVIGLLSRDQGATLVDISDLTGWLPHTARAALTGLRKNDHAITKAKRGDITSYHIASRA